MIVALVFAISVVSSTSAENSIDCDRSCGSGAGFRRLPHPFGFSEGCKIRLHCSGNGEIRIGEFQVQNVTPDRIVVNIPPSCDRTIGSLWPLFGTNYALTMQNGLLLHGCPSNLTGCVIPGALTRNRFDQLPNCDPNISCFSGEYREGMEFLSYEDVNRTRCTRLFSSVAVESEKRTNSTVSLEFQTALLEWWLEGPCRCSENATCSPKNLTSGRLGFQCRCKDGFAGDGFDCRRHHAYSRSRKTSKVGVLIGGLFAGACLMAVMILGCFLIQRRSTFLKNRRSAKRLLCAATGSSSIPFFPYKQIERATNCFSEKQRLGTGAYGTVYAGKLHNGEWVAVKKIKHRDTDSIEQVVNEVKLLSCVSHPNLVRLLGCCIEEGEQILVYEFMPNGTLSQHLQRERGEGLAWTIRLTIATETAHAIAHLHSAMSPPIYHRDIKSSNILLDYNFNSKVADFGLSRLGLMESSHISTAPQGTPGYLDPQYHQNFHLSDKSDVYSFGVVLVEIITGLKVVDFSRPHSEVNLAALAIDRIGRGCVDEIIDPFLEPHRDAWTLSSVHKVAELAFRCLAFHRDMRPSMMEVADELENVRVSGWAPLEENVGAASSVVSSGSSPYNASEKSQGGISATNASEKSQGGISATKSGVGSQRLTVPQRPSAVECLPPMEVKDSSPVSVRDPWLSEQSSPSTNGLLGSVSK